MRIIKLERIYGVNLILLDETILKLCSELEFIGIPFIRNGIPNYYGKKASLVYVFGKDINKVKHLEKEYKEIGE